MDLTTNWEGRRRRRKTVWGGGYTERTERNSGGRSREDEKGGLVLWGHIQISVCASRFRAGRTAAITHLMMCSTNQPGWIFILHRSWRLKPWIVSGWLEIRLWTRLPSLSTSCWGLKGTNAIKATQRQHGLPDDYRPAQWPARMYGGAQCLFLSLHFIDQYKAITKRWTLVKKNAQLSTVINICFSAEISGRYLKIELLVADS